MPFVRAEAANRAVRWRIAPRAHFRQSPRQARLRGVAAIVGLGTALLLAPSAFADRAYEMVSPVDKNGGNVDRDRLESLTAQSAAAPDGDVVAFVSRLQFGEIEGGSLFPNYVGRRHSEGWATEGISPPLGNVDIGTEIPRVSALSPDLMRAFVVAPRTLTSDAGQLGGSWGLYLRRSVPVDRYQLLSKSLRGQLSLESQATNASVRFEFADATPDSRHVVFNSARQLIQDAPPDVIGTGANAVYEAVDGVPRLVSVLPSTMSLAGLVAAGSSTLTGGALPGDHLISSDGRRVFFTADVLGSGGVALGDQLFVREDGAETKLVSASERTGEDPAAQGVSADFWSASASDGAIALFSSNAPLVDGGGEGSLYRWDAAAPEGERLTELSKEPGGAPGVLGPAAVTDDVSTAYFVANGVLGGSADAKPGEPNLYRWRAGQGVRYIATLDAAQDVMMWTPGYTNGGPAARVSADGGRLLFASYAQLDDSYSTIEATPEACGDPTIAGDRCRQVYLYDDATGTTTCITCVSGVPVSDDANLFGNGDIRRSEDTIETSRGRPRNLSGDGTHAFFETARQLSSGDHNLGLDVYEWRDPDLNGKGALHLVSTGMSAQDSKFLDASATGRDVFFTTSDQLVGIDRDEQIDLYDARVGGGLPAQNPLPPPIPCEGEACQGPPAGRPELPGTGSSGDGSGNVKPGRRPSFSVGKLSRRQLRRFSLGRPMVLRVRVNRAGRVTARAHAAIGGKRLRVAKGSRVARSRGVVRIRLRLSHAARAVLARRGSLRTKLSVSFGGVGQPNVRTIELRAARAQGQGVGR